MPDPGTLSTADPLVASLQALPMGVHVVLGAGMAAGLVLWLAGSRVARPMFGLIGVVLGATIGFFLAPILATEPVRDIPTPYLGLGIGGLLGLAIAVALFRFTMAIGAAAVLALAGMVGTSVYMDRLHPAPESEPAPQISTAPVESPGDDGRLRSALESGALHAALGTNPDQTEWARQTAQRTREFLGRAGEKGQARWERIPGEHRLMVAGGGVGGGVFGFLLGVFVPRKAAALVTALAGSAMWLACAAWIAHATGAPGLALLDQPKQVWLVIWPLTAAAGMLVQWIGIVRARGKSG